MHAHAKFRDEKSFVQEETKRTKIILLIGVECEFCINSAPNPINIWFFFLVFPCTNLCLFSNFIWACSSHHLTINIFGLFFHAHFDVPFEIGSKGGWEMLSISDASSFLLPVGFHSSLGLVQLQLDRAIPRMFQVDDASLDRAFFIFILKKISKIYVE